MELQIQDLVSSIRKEGIEAANAEAESIIAEAKKKAESIVAGAKSEAQQYSVMLSWRLRPRSRVSSRRSSPLISEKSFLVMHSAS